jgi:hypothetical protein
MSGGGQQPSNKVAAFMAEHDAYAVDEATGRPPERGWPIGRLLALLVGLPLAGLALLFFGVIRTCACTPTPQPSSPIEGTVVAVEADWFGFGEVQGFAVEDATGRTFSFRISATEAVSDFPLSQLRNRQASKEQVKVSWQSMYPTNGRYDVTRLEDASD